jgi:hypothetical protein
MILTKYNTGNTHRKAKQGGDVPSVSFSLFKKPISCQAFKLLVETRQEATVKGLGEIRLILRIGG